MQAEQTLPSEEPKLGHGETNGTAGPAYYSPPGSLNGRRTASLYRGEEGSRSPSPGPLNGSVPASPLHSLAAAGALANGALGLAPPTPSRSYQSSPKAPDATEPYHSGYAPGQPLPLPSGYRVDDVTSRSNRLEEALLRASTKGSAVSSASGLSPAPSASSSGRTSADELLELKKRSGSVRVARAPPIQVDSSGVLFVVAQGRHAGGAQQAGEEPARAPARVLRVPAQTVARQRRQEALQLGHPQKCAALHPGKQRRSAGSPSSPHLAGRASEKAGRQRSRTGSLRSRIQSGFHEALACAVVVSSSPARRRRLIRNENPIPARRTRRPGAGRASADGETRNRTGSRR